MIDEQNERAARVWREADQAGEDAYVEAVQTGTTADKAHAAGNAAATAAIAREFEALEAENARLREALIWCSGSNDFNEGGVARVGWLKLCAPLLSRAALKEPSHEHG